MNGMPLPVERVALTPAEQRYFAPIWDRFQEAQKELNAVVDLFAAAHEDELRRDGRGGWQLAKDGFVRESVPSPTSTQVDPTEQPVYSNGAGELA